jgi:hypothetical protein
VAGDGRELATGQAGGRSVRWTTACTPDARGQHNDANAAVPRSPGIEHGNLSWTSLFGFEQPGGERRSASENGFIYYNFARVHQALRVTPAMEAGPSDHVWSIGEIVALLG